MLTAAVVVAIAAFVIRTVPALFVATAVAVLSGIATAMLYSAEIRRVRLMWAQDRVDWTVAERDRQIGHARIDALHTDRLTARYVASEAELQKLRTQLAADEAARVKAEVLAAEVNDVESVELVDSTDDVTEAEETCVDESVAEAVEQADVDAHHEEQVADAADEAPDTASAVAQCDDVSNLMDEFVEPLELIELDELVDIGEFDLDSSFAGDEALADSAAEIHDESVTAGVEDDDDSMEQRRTA